MYERLVLNLRLQKSLSAKILYPIQESLKLSKPSYTIYRGLGRTEWHISVSQLNHAREFKKLQKIDAPPQTSILLFTQGLISQWPPPHKWPTARASEESGGIDITFYGELEEDEWYGGGTEGPLA